MSERPVDTWIMPAAGTGTWDYTYPGARFFADTPPVADLRKGEMTIGELGQG